MSGGERYQPEIDGLRAVAIIAVVLYHAGVPGFGSGFVGVDIFFVISGFLISRMLISELHRTGKIDFIAFYARRVRRLLPALAVVLAVVLLLGTFVLSVAGEWQDLAESAAVTVTFVANIYFWRSQAGYFALPSDRLVFLNMWTLSVEEQFYLVWPALLLLTGIVARVSRHRLPTTIGATLALLFAVSFAVFLWGAQAKPTATFYLTPTRVWEFALGGALVLAEKNLQRWRPVAGYAALAGLAAIAISVIGRGYLISIAIMPAAFGAAAVIGGISVLPGSVAGRLLAAAPVVVVGKLSYSWYLWHWPLLALVRIYDFGSVNRTRDLLVALGSLGLAALTYVFIENPIRRRRPWPFAGAWQTVAMGAGLSAAVAVVALAVYVRADVLAQRDPWLAAIAAARSAKVPAPAACHVALRFSGLTPTQDCLIGAAGATPRILLWGDSHAQHHVDLIRQDGIRNGYAAIARTMSACPPLAYVQTGQTRLRVDCLKFNAAVADEISALAPMGLKGIVLAARGFDYPAAPAADMARWQENLRGTLAMARGLRLRVLVIAPVPTWKFPVPECLAHLTIVQCGISRAMLDHNRAPLVAALMKTVAEFDNARLWDPINSFCDGQVCLPVRDGVILYWDASHLTLSGSRSLAPAAAPYLHWLTE